VATGLDNVMFLQQTRVQGLLYDSTGSTVVGVRLRFQHEASGEATTEYPADLVVDCSGRHSDAPAWLEEMGYRRPAESMVNAQLGYASRVYRRNPNCDWGWRALFIQAAPPECPRGGVLFPIEGDRWLLTLVGGGGDFAPTDEEAYREFARSLPHAGFLRIMESCAPLSPIVGYRRTENRWRHYERIDLPDRFLVMGDSVCCFNPVYGQGITVSALECLELDRCLREQPSGRVFQRRLAKVIRGAWDFSTGEDMRYQGVEGATAGAAQRCLHWYIDRTMDASTRDREVRHGFLQVFAMQKPPSSLFRPGMLLRILARGRSGTPITRHNGPPLNGDVTVHSGQLGLPLPHNAARAAGAAGPITGPTVSESSMSVSETCN
jgi:hypothetical protein